MSTRRGFSNAPEAHQAAAEFYAAVVQPEMSLALFFCTCDYDLAELGQELGQLFGQTPLIGCTTTCALGPGGYTTSGITGVSFAADAFTVVTGSLENLQNFEPHQARELCHELTRELERRTPLTSGRSSFALLMIDGSPMQEETVALTLQDALRGIRLLGGTACSKDDSGAPCVYSGNQFRANCATLTIFSTKLPFELQKTQHFVATDQRMVITEADPGRRIVSEINGRPAAEEYARLLGLHPALLTQQIFAAAPVAVMIKGAVYVRSIYHANPDASLQFLCAIERGVILRLAHGEKLLENLQQSMNSLRAQLGPPQLVIGFDCAHRRMEILERGFEQEVGRILLPFNTIACTTMGEQYCGIHINQTFSCVMIGNRAAEAPQND